MFSFILWWQIYDIVWVWANVGFGGNMLNPKAKMLNQWTIRKKTLIFPWFFIKVLVGGLEHGFYFPFHIWDVILPIDELHPYPSFRTPSTRRRPQSCWKACRKIAAWSHRQGIWNFQGPFSKGTMTFCRGNFARNSWDDCWNPLNVQPCASHMMRSRFAKPPNPNQCVIVCSEPSSSWRICVRYRWKVNRYASTDWWLVVWNIFYFPQ